MSQSSFPFANVEGNLFPPVCLKTHWDPTQMLRHILPQQKVGLPEDFRPWVKVCKKYVTSAPAIPAPMPPSDMVFPTGGEFYPPGRYAANIDKESMLRTLDHPLDTWCPSTQYIPKQSSNMYVAGSTLPDRKAITDAFVSELAMPQVLLRLDSTTCRSENDAAYFERSGRLFNNPTKQDRYGANKYYAHPGGGRRGDPMPHGGVNSVQPTKQALKGRGGVPQPGGDTRPTSHQGYGSTRDPGSNGSATVNTGCTSFVGVSTCGSAARVW